MSLTAEELFVFAGAGISMSSPAGLPNFDEIRDEILRQLGLPDFVRGTSSREKETKEFAVARALVPEPFMLDLREAGIPIESWLEDVLGRGEPNAAHQALAQLAVSGARVWTVNFERLVERADPRVAATSWPRTPADGSSLVKAHGSLGGPLICAADQVLTSLPHAWRERLRADVEGRIALFVGYRGRDLDFQPLWNELLDGAREVVWFDQPDTDDPTLVTEEDWKRLLLHDVDRRRALRFPRAAPRPPDHRRASNYPNASWDFVRWCGENGLIEIDEESAVGLLAPRPAPVFAPLEGDLTWAKAAVLGHLGDYRGVRREYLGLLSRGRNPRRAMRALVEVQANQGGRPTAAMLSLCELLPSVGAGRALRAKARRKRLTIYHREGRTRAILRATREVGPDEVSTPLILRAAALRVGGSLEAAVEAADEALARARSEKHAVRSAHAAFQKAHSLMWAERIEEAEHCLRYELEPLAANASNRWVAWADFIAASLSVHRGNAKDALARFAVSETRFDAEALVDGRIGVGMARLAARRLACEDAAFRSELDQLTGLMQAHGPRERYYARRNRFTGEAISIERAEFARSGHRRDVARALYRRVADSNHPIHAALAELGLAMIDVEEGKHPERAERARDIAASIGAGLVARRADELLDPSATDACRQVFFC